MEELNPARALAIVAHPDDIEYFCGGTLAKWISKGCQVSYVVTTSGDKGSSNPEEDIQKLIITREDEQRASANVLGVRSVTYLQYPDSELNFVDLKELRGEYVRYIRKTQAEVVLTHDPYVRLLKQHPDHRLVGQLVIDASYPLSTVSQCYREQIVNEGLATCQPDYLLLFGTDLPNYFTDISQTLDIKIRALQEHRSQESAFHGGIENRLRWKAQSIGKSHSINAAEEFLLVRTGPSLPT